MKNIVDEVQTRVFIDGTQIGLINELKINQDFRASLPNKIIISRLVLPGQKRIRDFIKKDSKLEIQLISKDEVFCCFKLSKLSIAEVSVVMSAESLIPLESAEIIARNYKCDMAD